jgi:hypothetical protein
MVAEVEPEAAEAVARAPSGLEPAKEAQAKTRLPSPERGAWRLSHLTGLVARTLAAPSPRRWKPVRSAPRMGQARRPTFVREVAAEPLWPADWRCRSRQPGFRRPRPASPKPAPLAAAGVCLPKIAAVVPARRVPNLPRPRISEAPLRSRRRGARAAAAAARAANRPSPPPSIVPRPSAPQIAAMRRSSKQLVKWPPATGAAPAAVRPYRSSVASVRALFAARTSCTNSER